MIIFKILDNKNYKTEESKKNNNIKRISFMDMIKNKGKELSDPELDKIDKFNQIQINDNLSKTDNSLTEDVNKIKLDRAYGVFDKIYSYLFNQLNEFNLCFNDFDNLLESAKDINQPAMKNIKDIIPEVFLKNYRKLDLPNKFNLLCYQLGNYNYQYLVNNYSENINMSELYKNYKGSISDLQLLNRYLTVVLADESGTIVFEEDIKPEIIEEKEIIQPKPAKKKKFGFSRKGD